jgi:hypothetical protein
MKRIEYQLRRCIYDDVAYTPRLAGYPILSDITKLYEIRPYKKEVLL